MRSFPIGFVCLAALLSAAETPRKVVTPKTADPAAAVKARAARLWSLQPVVRPAVPAGAVNPIDAFIADYHQKKGLRAVGRGFDVWPR